MNSIERLIALEENAIGETADKNNVIKYNIEYGLPGHPWCVMFQWSKFKEAGLSDLFYGGYKIASCRYFYSWALNTGLVVSNIKEARPGDIIIFSFAKDKDGSRQTSHMGLCVGSDEKYIYSIDGNTAEVGNESNGMKVLKRKREWAYVLYVIRPNYSDAVPEKEPDEPQKDEHKFYVVQSGDYLSKIAAKHNMSLSELLSKNPQIKNPNLIYKGQVINL